MLRKYLPFLAVPGIEVLFLAVAVLLLGETSAATGEFEGISYHTLQIAFQKFRRRRTSPRFLP